jgi:cytochrome b subunit of formate dehydrogenase
MSSTVKNSSYELVDVTTPFERLVHLAFAGSCILLFISGFALMLSGNYVWRTFRHEIRS